MFLRRLELPGYVLEYDSWIETDVYRHKATGVKIWSNVVDVSFGALDKACILHYTTNIGASNITNAAKSSAEIWTSLKPENALFGFGIYGSVKSPGAFGSRETILRNNYRAQINDNPAILVDWADRVNYCIPIVAAVSGVYVKGHKSGI